jgi:hypothetical protein
MILLLTVELLVIVVLLWEAVTLLVVPVALPGVPANIAPPSTSRLLYVAEALVPLTSPVHIEPSGPTVP